MIPSVCSTVWSNDDDQLCRTDGVPGVTDCNALTAIQGTSMGFQYTAYLRTQAPLSIPVCGLHKHS